MTKLLAGLASAVCLSATSACGPGVDLAKALEVTNVLTGYYDSGVKDGKNYLRPSITFALHNRAAVTVGSTQLTVSFWKTGDDGEWESVVIKGISADGLAAGASTAALLARCPVGYTLEGARADLFTHPLFKDVTAKVFASRAGDIVPIGQFKIDHVILPTVKGSTE